MESNPFLVACLDEACCFRLIPSSRPRSRRGFQYLRRLGGLPTSVVALAPQGLSAVALEPVCEPDSIASCGGVVEGGGGPAGFNLLLHELQDGSECFMKSPRHVTWSNKAKAIPIRKSKLT